MLTRRTVFAAILAIILATLFEVTSFAALRVIELLAPERVLESRLAAMFLEDPTDLERHRDHFVSTFHDPQLGWEPRPGVELLNPGTPDQWTLTTINDGARQPYDAEREIVAFAYGDSFTRGAEVNDDDAWPHVLEKLSQLGVRNYGVGAYSIYQSILRFERHIGEGRRAQIVILGIQSSKLARSMNSLAAHLRRDIRFEERLAFRPWVRMREGHMVEHENPWTDPQLDGPGFASVGLLTGDEDFFVEHNFVRRRFPYSLTLVRLLKRSLAPVRVLDVWDRPEAQAVFALLMKRFFDDCASIDAEPIVVFLPGGADVRRVADGRGASYVWGKEFISQNWPEVAVIDVLDHVEPEEFESWYVRPLAGHAGRLGNRRTAELVLPVLEEKVRELERPDSSEQ